MSPEYVGMRIGRPVEEMKKMRFCPLSALRGTPLVSDGTIFGIVAETRRAGGQQCGRRRKVFETRFFSLLPAAREMRDDAQRRAWRAKRAKDSRERKFRMRSWKGLWKLAIDRTRLNTGALALSAMRVFSSFSDLASKDSPSSSARIFIYLFLSRPGSCF